MQEKKQINVEVGSNVKRKREQVGLTQEQLSEKIGIGVKSLSAIERGTVGVSLLTLRNICDALNVSSDALLFGDEKTNIWGSKHPLGLKQERCVYGEPHF